MGHVTFTPSASPVRMAPRTWYTVALSMLVHTIGLAALVAVPLFATGALPTPESVLAFVTPPPPPASPPAPAPPRTPANVVDRSFDPDAAPPEAPNGVTPEPQPSLFTGMVATPELLSGPTTTLARPVIVPPPVVPDVPVRPGGDVREPRKVHDVMPVYPAIARAAKVDGVVILEATIARDGTVRDAHVLRSAAMLDQAALDAVRLWRYSPSLLNGIPVEVLVTVTVRFTLR